MFERLKRLYDEKKIDDAALQRAVTLGWITEDQAAEIRGDKTTQTGDATK